MLKILWMLTAGLTTNVNPFPWFTVQAPVYRPARSPDSPHCCLHPGSLPFSGSQTSQAYFCHKAFSLTMPLTQMCFSGPHRTALFHLGLEPFLFTQPKGSLNHTLLLYPVLSQLLSETEIPFFFLTYLLPLSLKRIQSMVVPLDTKYSVCRHDLRTVMCSVRVCWIKE